MVLHLHAHIFTEYTGRVAFGDYANEVLKICASTTAKHMVIFECTSAVHLSFFTVAHIELWIFAFVFIN